FVVVESMDAYRDDGMGDVIVGRPFCKEACVKARRFDEMITIYKRDDSVTYQIARSHPRFKHLTNAQRNKMRPLLKVSTHDKWKDISHPYQKLKGFYKEVFNLGPEYIKDEKVEEWLTRRHVSIHEMEWRAEDKSNLKTSLTLLNENDDYGGVLIFRNCVCYSRAGIQTLSQNTILLINAAWRIIPSKS
ncbi:hypothetical protein Tco_1460412, partial [Tanacetum coccineum]